MIRLGLRSGLKFNFACDKQNMTLLNEIMNKNFPHIHMFDVDMYIYNLQTNI